MATLNPSLHPVYVETEEEIPEVIERVRRATATEVPIVLPVRSRFGQSRFNFQLLREYAGQLGKRVSIVSADPAVQQLAEEAGFQAYRAVDQLGVAPAAGAAAAAVPVERVLDLPPPRPASPVAGPPAAGAAGAAAGAAAPRIRISEPARLASRTATELKPGRTILYAGATLLLMVGIVAGAFFVPSAQVTLTANATQFTQEIAVDGAPGKPPVRVRTAPINKTSSGSFKATGVKTTPGTVATGAVVYTNKCPGIDVGLEVGRRLRGAGGIQFAQNSGNQDLPNGKKGVWVPSGESASASIIATSPGANGNLDANTINVIEGVNLTCLTVTNPSATSGGQDEKKETIIQASDLDAARQSLETQLRRDSIDELSKQAAPGEKLADPVFNAPDFNPDHKLGDVVGGFSASLKLTGEGSYYFTEDVDKAFAAALAKKVPASQQLTDNKPATNYSVQASPGGQLAFTGKASSFVAPKIDRDKLRALLTGHSVAEDQALLRKQPVASAEIHQSPFKLPFMPLTSSRIDIRYVIREVAPAPSR